MIKWGRETRKRVWDEKKWTFSAISPNFVVLKNSKKNQKSTYLVTKEIKIKK